MRLLAQVNSNEAQKILVTSKILNQTLQVEDAKGKGETTPTGLSVPALQADESTIIKSTNAIMRYLVSTAPPSDLRGSSPIEQAQVDSWLEWTTNDVDHAGLMPSPCYDKELGIIEAHVKSRTFLVGQRLTLADVALAISLRQLPIAAGTHPATYRWVNTCYNHPAFKGVSYAKASAGPAKQVSATSSRSAPKAAPKATPAPQAPEKRKSATSADHAALEAQKEKVRVLKTNKGPKDEIGEAVKELLRLKELCGETGPAAPKAKQQPAAAHPAKSENDGPKSEKELAKEAKKAAKEAEKKMKEEEKLKREEERKAAELAKLGPSLTLLTMDSHPCGNLFIQSHKKTDRKWSNVQDLTKELKGQSVWLRCRIQASRKQSKFCFLELREGMNTVQAIAKDELLNFASTLTVETVVDVEALVDVPPEPIKSCSQTDVELKITRLYSISRAAPLPFQIVDASRSEAELAADETLVRVNQDVRLDNRIIDLRTAANQAIFRLQSAVCQLFREYLTKEKFVEIHTPKLIGTASEGGANVFKCNYFGGDAFLAQSPQLYKQMALMADLPRVFEVAPVFRAEDSFTHRHLTEFVGLDMEMVFKEHYSEVLDVLDGLFDYIFTNLNARFRPEIETVRKQYPFKDLKWKGIKDGGCLILRFDEAITLLRAEGPKILEERLKTEKEVFFIKKYNDHIVAMKNKNLTDDLSTEDEKVLGEVISNKYDQDFYIIDKFPAEVRPFYTMVDPEDPKWTNSYDIFIRGEEIMSGAQRIHDPDMLLKKAKSMEVDMTPIMDYVNAFKYGAFPHAGGGVGMERVVMLFLSLNNIRKTSMFPRDPKRITP